MRSLFVTLIVLEACLLTIPLFSNPIYSPRASRAWYELNKNKSQETERVWNLEKARLQRQRLIVDSAYLALLAFNTVAAVVVWRKLSQRDARKGVGSHF